MDIIDDINKSTDKGTDIGKKYIATSYKYTKLKIFQLVTVSITTIVKLFFIGGLLSTGMIFLSFAAANYIGEFYNDITVGYLFVGLFFFIISLIIFAIRKFLEKKIIQNMSKIFFD